MRRAASELAEDFKMKEFSTLVVNSDSLTRGCLAPQPPTRLGSCAVSSVENVWNSYILQLYVITPSLVAVMVLDGRVARATTSANLTILSIAAL